MWLDTVPPLSGETSDPIAIRRITNLMGKSRFVLPMHKAKGIVVITAVDKLNNEQKWTLDAANEIGDWTTQHHFSVDTALEKLLRETVPLADPGAKEARGPVTRKIEGEQGK